jgi:acetyl-CoA carboxylase biotin carboxyl carrier protein
VAVDLRKIKKLIELVEESSVTELEVRDGEETIRIARGAPATAAPIGPAPAAAPPLEPPAPAAAQTPAAPSFAVSSPMAGTFYRAASPDARAFVEVGQAVEPGDVLCIIESMKMMNEVLAERGGVCTAVAVENGAAVGTGDVLFRFA